MKYEEIFCINGNKISKIGSILPPYKNLDTWATINKDSNNNDIFRQLEGKPVIINNAENFDLILARLQKNSITISDSTKTTITIDANNNITTFSEYRKSLSETKWINLCRAMECFELAQNRFTQNLFSEAEDYITQYQKYVDYNDWAIVDTRNHKSTPKLTVVVVAYNTTTDLLACLYSLQKQQNKDFEIIVVDNGGNKSVWNQLHQFELLHVQCPINVILSEGRNIGVNFSKSEYIAFLDDDALVPENYTHSIIEAFETRPTTLGFRGKVLEKTPHENNKIAGHYDLGNKPIVHICNTEGNSAFRRNSYLEAGGMNPLLFGEEGTDLSARICNKHGVKSIIYWPKTIIFHDYANTDDKRDIKLERHERMTNYTKSHLPHVAKYNFKMKLYKLPGKLLKLFGIRRQKC